MEFLSLWFVAAIVVGVMAGVFGRSGFGWFVLAIFISPLLAGLLVLILPRIAPAAMRDASGEVITPKTHVRCPDCRELVRKDANKCKHCAAALRPQ